MSVCFWSSRRYLNINEARVKSFFKSHNLYLRSTFISRAVVIPADWMDMERS